MERDILCPTCREGHLVQQTGRGAIVCNVCGYVAEDQQIVQDAQFTEVRGRSALEGQWVTGSGQLNLRTHHIEAAHSFFTMAVDKNFIQGRKTDIVAAVCLYMVCRREALSNMLIDFADIIQTSVYRLGSTYMKFCRVLGSVSKDIPMVDPAWYVQRFAKKLEFGDMESAVVTTATRLVARMKRDWMQLGRRPAGICAAALLIASRLHGFNRTQEEIVDVVRICDATLRKRLREFSATATASLTANEFEHQDLTIETDPPAFQDAQRVEARFSAESKAKRVAKASDTVKSLWEEAAKRRRAELQEEQAERASQAAQSLERGEHDDEEELAEEISRDAAMMIDHLHEDGEEVDRVMYEVDDRSVEELTSLERSTYPTLLPGESLSDADDDEVDAMILGTREVAAKKRLWDEVNKEWLDEKAKKEEERKKELAALPTEDERRAFLENEKRSKLSSKKRASNKKQKRRPSKRFSANLSADNVAQLVNSMSQERPRLPPQQVQQQKQRALAVGILDGPGINPPPIVPMMITPDTITVPSSVPISMPKSRHRQETRPQSTRRFRQHRPPSFLSKES